MTPEEVATIIESFIEGTPGRWDWDGFISLPINDDYLDRYRQRCATLDREYPPATPGSYCNDMGIELLRSMVSELREKKDSR